MKSKWLQRLFTKVATHPSIAKADDLRLVLFTVSMIVSMHGHLPLHGGAVFIFSII
jgi:hypothetical protein